ncbi:Crp/Fnr family transcriptional regulator [Psychroserpens sp.]|uniref:Crp/Fnr family transcriptional regulator n=1 Tax=Psychroserpens sp. TaxID=2020870 RepID=UPI001B2647F1|nr:Crp/Fnr family transcriptional regulator [Psychroserpens sp.]MBO6605566.1 Crp/Fnr family transcriptional regulator [Psychroserpens sp.]MBO6630025.1 Crp/Fnr family transcriptional regulator [Psychroserpens sp.]MBO6653625.1 Crp/Fnr family transcriptional regulator [Psychroserpens sp.]MBO6681946.1 Crp/Fnr family transcriptional regulator [Psychroserpens sp.]MBO6748940.1 Crp/Fnr family transcriptional regulator [Psychroserpens sp.]
MNNPNFDFLRSRFNISKETFDILQGLSRRRILKAGEKTIQQGGTSTKVHFLVSGLMRAIVTVESGKQYTKNIYSPISFVAPFSSMLKNEPSLLCYEALTECRVFEIDFTEFIRLTKTDIRISNLYNRVLEYLYVVYEKKQLESISLNATERYKILKKRIPSIDNLIAQYHIASYLNITPVQLSRIRKALK